MCAASIPLIPVTSSSSLPPPPTHLNPRALRATLQASYPAEQLLPWSIRSLRTAPVLPSLFRMGHTAKHTIALLLRCPSHAMDQALGDMSTPPGHPVPGGTPIAHWPAPPTCLLRLLSLLTFIPARVHILTSCPLMGPVHAHLSFSSTNLCS